MTVLTQPGAALTALSDLFTWASEVRMAYAWATSKGGRAAHWKRLDLAKIDKAVIGVQFAQTEPGALRALADLDVLKVVADATGVFHPKVVVGTRSGEARALVGSSNLTGGGFPARGGNVEVNVLLEGSATDDQLADLARFIEDQWDNKRAFVPSSDWLDEYEDAHKHRPPPAPVPPPDSVADITLSDLDVEWDDFVALLYAQERRSLANGSQIRVFDFPDEGSYLEEAEYCAIAFEAEPHFAKMPDAHRRLVAGWGHETSGYYGRNTGAGYFKQVVMDEPEKISDHLDRLPLNGPVSESLARSVLEGLISVRGVALGVATRLLCVKRPDLFLVVNNANKIEMKRIFGSAPTSVGSYFKRMQRIWSMPWFSAPQPAPGPEQRLWNARVALLDAVMYEIPPYQQ